MKAPHDKRGLAAGHRGVTGLVTCVGMWRVRLRLAGTVVELRRRGAHGDRLRMRQQVTVTAAGVTTIITDNDLENNTGRQ